MTIKAKPTTLQNDNGDVLFPVSGADLIKRSGSPYNVEESLKMKAGYKIYDDSLIESQSPGIEKMTYDTNKEVIDARGGKDNLKDRLDGLDNRLKSFDNKFTQFNVKDYGALGDGVTDDSDAIRSCINDLPDNDFELVFPPGIYIQGDGSNPHYDKGANGMYSGEVGIGKEIYFEFKDKKNFKVIGYGASIHAHKNNSCISNNRGFTFINCHYGLVEGITYNGEIESRQPWGGDAANYNNQSGFKTGGCSHITFYKCKAIGCVMDGFTFGGIGRTFETYSNYIKMIDCISIKNYRQGLSVVNGHYGILDNCIFAETGTIYGTSPKAGVDMEQGYTNYQDRGQRGWKIKNCTFTQNAGDGLALHWGTHETLVEGCIFIDDSIFCPSDSEYLTVNNTISNCKFENSSGNFGGGGLLFEKNVCYNSNFIVSNDKRTYDLGFSRKDIVVENIFSWDFNIEEEDVDSAGVVINKRRWITTSPYTVFNNNILNNPTGTFILYCSGGGSFLETRNNIFRGTKELPDNIKHLGSLDAFALSDNGISENNIITQHYKTDTRINRLSNTNTIKHLNYIENRYFKEDNKRIDIRLCKEKNIDNIAHINILFNSNEKVSIVNQGANGKYWGFKKSNVNGSTNKIFLSKPYLKEGYFYVTLKPFSSTSNELVATEISIIFTNTHSSDEYGILKQVQNRGYEVDLTVDTLEFFKPLASDVEYASKPLSSDFWINIGDKILINKLPYFYKGNDEWIGIGGDII